MGKCSGQPLAWSPPLTFTAALTSGTIEQKTSRLAVRVVELALTSGDAYEV